MEGEAVSGAQLIAQALRAQVRARSGDRQPAACASGQPAASECARQDSRRPALPLSRGWKEGKEGRFRRTAPGTARPQRRRELLTPGRVSQADTNSLPRESLPRSRACPVPELRRSPVTTEQCRGSCAALPVTAGCASCASLQGGELCAV